MDKKQICAVCYGDTDIYHKGVRQGATDFARKVIHRLQLEGRGQIGSQELYTKLQEFLKSDLAHSV